MLQIMYTFFAVKYFFSSPAADTGEIRFTASEEKEMKKILSVLSVLVLLSASLFAIDAETESWLAANLNSAFTVTSNIDNTVCLAVQVPAEIILPDANPAGTDHGTGDYIVCAVNEDGTPDLSTLTVINGLEFSSLYTTAE